MPFVHLRKDSDNDSVIINKLNVVLPNLCEVHLLIGFGIQLWFLWHTDVNVLRGALVHQNVTLDPSKVEL